MSTPSPVTPLGAKGVGEGNCMSTPACLANAVADALGRRDVQLPLTPPRLAGLISSDEKPSKRTTAAPASGKRGSGLAGRGEAVVPAAPDVVWQLLLDPRQIAAALPGCHAFEVTAENAYRAEVTIGVGPVRGRYAARLRLSDLDAPRSLSLRGEGVGALGVARGDGTVELIAQHDGGTTVRYRYDVEIGGKVAAVGARMLDGAARMLIGRFFERLVEQAKPGAAGPASRWRRLMRGLGMRP
jgi:2-furoyl-CoA dehydrogenase large subunit